MLEDPFLLPGVLHAIKMHNLKQAAPPPAIMAGGGAPPTTSPYTSGANQKTARNLLERLVPDRRENGPAEALGNVWPEGQRTRTPQPPSVNSAVAPPATSPPPSAANDRSARHLLERLVPDRREKGPAEALGNVWPEVKRTLAHQPTTASPAALTSSTGSPPLMAPKHEPDDLLGPLLAAGRASDKPAAGYQADSGLPTGPRPKAPPQSPPSTPPADVAPPQIGSHLMSGGGTPAVGGSVPAGASPSREQTVDARLRREGVRRAVMVALEDDYVVDVIDRALSSCGFRWGG
jgi:hypothetical protein